MGNISVSMQDKPLNGSEPAWQVALGERRVAREDHVSKKEGARAQSEEAATVEISKAAQDKYAQSVGKAGDADSLDAAAKAYREAFDAAADGFADFSDKITIGDYNHDDVSAEDIDLGVIDRMEDLYESYQEKIRSSYSGEEMEEHLKRLDDAYNGAFESKILDPLKRIYEDKADFFHPSDVEHMGSWTMEAYDASVLLDNISNFMINEAIKRQQTGRLQEGAKDFFSLSEDSSRWHDVEDVKGVLGGFMDSYASVKQVNVSAYVSKYDKMYADALSKKLSDQYEAMLAYREERLGLGEDGEGDGNESGNAYAEALNAFPIKMASGSGLYVVDVSKIQGLDEMIDEMQIGQAW